MQARQRDTVKVESDAGAFDRFTSLQITNDLMSPSEAAFEVGDDSTWRELEDFIALGNEFRVFVNNHLHLTGRVELADAPIDPAGGSVVRFTIRTKLADAWYAGANHKARVKGVSIRDFIIEVYEPLGYTADDFEFRADVARDLLTGKGSDGSEPPADLEPMKAEQAKVNPPETIQAAVDKHLRRYGYMHWDSPDGKIVVGTPNDQQEPKYRLRMLLGAEGRENNILSATRTRDASGIPTRVGVYGVGGKREFTKAKTRAFAQNQELLDAGFYRPINIIAEQAKTDALAQRYANRELTDRSKRFDAWSVLVDGLSYWNGHERIVYGVDTVADINTSVVGGPAGAYLLHQVTKTRDASAGDTAALTFLKRGLWVL